MRGRVRRDRPSRDIQPAGFFVVRTPLLPLDDFTGWHESAGAAAFADPELLRRHLWDLCQRPEIREALFLGSPSLEESLDVWHRQPGCERGQRVERAVGRYFARMAVRPTPFGLFAGCSMGTIGHRTRIRLADRVNYRRSTRLDMEYLAGLAGSLAAQPGVRRRLSYRANSSLYAVGDRLHYVEWRATDATIVHHLVSVETSTHLARVLEAAKGGATFPELAAVLVDESISAEEAEQFVEELAGAQILVSELEPCLTGPSALAELRRALQRAAVEGPAVPALGHVEREMAAIDTRGLGVSPADYRAIAARLGQLPAPVNLTRLFQVDMMKPIAEAALSTTIVGEILRGVEVLQELAGPHRDPLARFRKRFEERYELQEVRLVEALDEEFGLGFGSAHDALLSGAEPHRAARERRDAALFARLSQVLGVGGEELSLQPDDIELLTVSPASHLPDAFAVLATVLAPSEEAIASGDYQVLVSGVVGPSGATMLGRFCYADPLLHAAVDAHLQEEEALHPDSVYAEVVHLPENRAGNVIVRPVLRAYEIPYLGRSGVVADRQIPLTDLYLSARRGRFVLRCRRLGMEIRPRLTSAHNFTLPGQLPIYRFLCALQHQDVLTGLTWEWGSAASCDFLPRVTVGRILLARAQWRLHSADLKKLAAERGAGRIQALRTLRNVRRLPRYVTLAEGDNHLPVDLENPLSCEGFLDLVRTREACTLLEMRPRPDEVWVSGPEGRFSHELILPFRQEKPRIEAGLHVDMALPQAMTVHRTFAPGSEWLYAKLYTGTATADRVLTDVIAPLREELVEGGLVDKWFFVRYRDPEPHLRIRFHGAPRVLREQVWPLLEAALAPLLGSGTVWRVQYDTYAREIERYGGPEAMVLVEHLFWIDSEAVLDLLRTYPGEGGLGPRNNLTMCGIDAIWSDFGLTVREKHEMVRARDATSAGERKLRSEHYRLKRSFFESLLEPGRQAPDALHRGLEILTRRSRQIQPIAQSLHVLDSQAQLTRSVGDQLRSYTHMHANRMLRLEHVPDTALEERFYDFLRRYYEARLARPDVASKAG